MAVNETRELTNDPTAGCVRCSRMAACTIPATNGSRDAVCRECAECGDCTVEKVIAKGCK